MEVFILGDEIFVLLGVENITPPVEDFELILGDGFALVGFREDEWREALGV